MNSLDPDDPRPPFRQVVDHLRGRIARGELTTGAQLPSLQELARHYGVSLGTVKSAVRVLRDDDVLVVRHGKGTFVRSGPAPLHETETPQDLRALTETVAALSRRIDAMEERLANL